MRVVSHRRDVVDGQRVAPRAHKAGPHDVMLYTHDALAIHQNCMKCAAMNFPTCW